MRIAAQTSLHVLLCAVLSLGSHAAWAEAKKAPAKTASTSKAKKTNHKASAKNSATAASHPEADHNTPDRELDEREQQFAKWVEQGTFACDEGGSVTLTAQSDKPGYFILSNRGQHYRVSPRVSITGAVRLESNTGGIVWLQLANKSMLIAPKLSRRLADGCMSESQKIIAAQMLRNPSPSIFDNSNAQPSAPAVAAAAPGTVAEPKNQTMPVLRLVEVPPSVVDQLPSKRAEQEAAAIMGGQ